MKVLRRLVELLGLVVMLQLMQVPLEVLVVLIILVSQDRCIGVDLIHQPTQQCTLFGFLKLPVLLVRLLMLGQLEEVLLFVQVLLAILLIQLTHQEEMVLPTLINGKQVLMVGLGPMLLVLQRAQLILLRF